MHPDIAYILQQVGNDLPALGEDDGLVEAQEFLDALHDKADGHFADGISDAIPAIEAERCSFGSVWISDPDEYRSRTAKVPDLTFDPAPLLAALDDIRTQHRPGGYGRAITAVRNARDEAETPDEPDSDDYEDDNDEYDNDREEYGMKTEYAAGLAYAAAQLVEHFGVDPDPDWEPSE